MKVVHRTPCKQSRTMNHVTGSEVSMKLENLQKTGSFKIRGAFNKIRQLTDAECAGGIICASAGNHAQGVALAGRERGIPVTVFMPEGTPDMKVQATKHYGATVKITGGSFDEACAAAKDEQALTGAAFVHPFDDFAIIEGQATVAMEMLQQNPDLDTIVVPAGGGGLLAGTALAVKAIRPDIRVVGVQAEAASALAATFHGRSAPPFGPTLAEGIRVKQPGDLTSSIIRDYADELVTVSEQEIASAILFMLQREKMLVEGAGAAAAAAVLHHRLPFHSARTGIIVSGGNLDIAKLESCRTIAAGIAAVSSY